MSQAPNLLVLVDLAMIRSQEFLEILGQSMGLKPELISESALRKALYSLAVRHGGSPEKWLDCLRADPAARKEFCEQFTVGETWFFRDWTPFACLREFLREIRNQPKAAFPIRLLSIPCSTGEEPWSMAMLLHQEDFRPDQVTIDAVDLNHHSLETLTKARYAPFSRRENHPEANALLDKYTTATSTGFEIDPRLKPFVRPCEGNLVDPRLDPSGRGLKYHLIFSRNLFIYLDPVSRSKGMANLVRLLDPKGIIYLGHTEGTLVTGFPLYPWKKEYLFAYSLTKTKNDTEKPTKKTDRTKPRSRSNIPVTLPPVPKPLKGTLAPLTKAATPNPADNQSLFNRGMQAANQGKLDDAAGFFQKLCEIEPLNAAAWEMAGTVDNARGRPSEALQKLDRVLYLDPENRATLRIAALICRQLGQIPKAEQLERRLSLVKGRPERNTQ